MGSWITHINYRHVAQGILNGSLAVYLVANGDLDQVGEGICLWKRHA